MKNGFIRVAAFSPFVRVADPRYNAAEIVKAAWRASTDSAQVLITPELSVTGYTCGDLFGQTALLDEAEAVLATICEETADLDLLLVVGVPLRHRGKLYNCAAAISGGNLLGVVPKTHLPAYGGFCEPRYFTPAFSGIEYLMTGHLQGIPIGTRLLFTCNQMPALRLAVELGEDLWAPSPPSVAHTAAGATLVANLSASGEGIGKAGYRRTLVASQSGRLVCGYVYADAGKGESTTDMVFSGHNLVAENGVILSESPLFSGDIAYSEIDLERIARERHRLSAFPDAEAREYYITSFDLEPVETPLSRGISAAPFVPADESELLQRCETALAIQAAGLAKRLAHANAKTAVLGISGGLDSTLALLVTCRAFAALDRSFKDIIAVTMPGFGTTTRTRKNAEKLCKALGVTLLTIDITATVRSHFSDIGHDENDHSVVYENAQARVRTLELMDIANQRGGLVVGTGDLSELALGWATYNGDHMSMYAVNASVPKTLIPRLIAHEAAKKPELDAVLQDILDTPVSPELLPADGDTISQQTEALVGPYELHDFFLYYLLRWGFSPSKILRLARAAFDGRYDETAIRHWLEVFARRFFAQQYKRSCLPDGPQIGSVGLSPRGAWRMPSDAVSDAWLRDLASHS